MSNASPSLAAASSLLSINRPLFLTPAPAGRRITAGFSFLQRIGKSASIDVWFPEMLHEELNALVSKGAELGPDNFPAEWAAVRQFELLQEAGNYKIYDMDATYLTRSLYENARNHRGGGYRVTVATIGSYMKGVTRDDLEILDKRLQKRIAHLIHMLYLEEQSEAINETNKTELAAGNWSFETALPHIGMTLGARDLFTRDEHDESNDEEKHKKSKKGSGDARRFYLAKKFFEILNLLPQNHIVHDTAVGLQLPESINENEWIYLASGDKTIQAFNSLLTDLFAPFDGINLGTLDGRTDAAPEVKAVTGHMRSYGDRLSQDADQFQRQMAQLALH